MTQNYANFISQFPVWPQNQLRFPGLEPVLNNTEKSCIALYFRKFLRIHKIIKLIPTSFVSPGLKEAVYNTIRNNYYPYPFI